MSVATATIEDVRRAVPVIRGHLSPVPLVRSYPLERELGLSGGRRVWLKDYGWTPVGSFKLMGALNWMHAHADRVGDRPIVAHSSGNFASGIAFAANRHGKRLVVVMPDDAPRIKFERTRSLGAEVRTFVKATDHLTGQREGLAREISENERAYPAHPYDDPHVIAGNGVGGLEVVEDLRREGRGLSRFLAPVSGGGLMAGLALAIADGFPDAGIVGVEPAGADDFRRSFASGERTRIEQPDSICDGLLSYEVGEHNWPILKSLLADAVAVPDDDTRAAMRWLYDHHGLRAEPSGAVSLAAALTGRTPLDGDGDVVIVVSGRNIDEDRFRTWIEG